LQDAAAGPADPTKFSGKKSKAMSKKGAGATQWEILMKSGIPPEEIPRFRCEHEVVLKELNEVRVVCS
jgi:leucyl-tRNA synthetase